MKPATFAEAKWTCKKGHLLQIHRHPHRVHLQSGKVPCNPQVFPRRPLGWACTKVPVFAPKNCDDPSFLGRSSLSEAVFGVHPSSSDTAKCNILLARSIKLYIGHAFLYLTITYTIIKTYIYTYLQLFTRIYLSIDLSIDRSSYLAI